VFTGRTGPSGIIRSLLAMASATLRLLPVSASDFCVSMRLIASCGEARQERVKAG
jgi:hypothetical protein